MMQFTQVVDSQIAVAETLTLPHEKRERSRLRVRLDSGVEAGLMLPRGTVLKGGDCIATKDGVTVRIIAQEEPLSIVVLRDPLEMAKACYHLGNRHTPLEIREHSVRYLYDPVVDDMVRSMGYSVEHAHGPFHPEGGAYHMPHIAVANDFTFSRSAA